MSKLTKESPTLSLMDRLEAKYRVREEFFTVQLPEGEVLKFRNVRTLSERKALRQAVTQFADKLDGNSPVHPSWKPYLPIDRDVAESLAAIAHLSVEPKFSDLDALKLHCMPGIADLISWQIQDAFMKANDLADVEEIEDAKKDSALTNSVESA